MKLIPHLLSAVTSLPLAVSPLFAADTITLAGIFDCVFYNAGESWSSTNGGSYASQISWTDEHKASMKRALTSWANTLTNDPGRNLTVGLFWGDYGTGSQTLGSASSSWHIGYTSNTVGNLQVYTDAESVWKTGSVTRRDDSYDIIINFNYSYADSFYYGADTDVNIGTQYDFQSVVMHEVAHALGVTSTSQADGTFRTFTNAITNDDVLIFTAFDALMTNAAGNKVVDVATANLTETGTATGFAAGDTITLSGSPLTVYNPNPWQEGSSMSHVEGEKDALMSYAIANNTFHRSMTASELQLMQSMGWEVNPSLIPEPTSTTLTLLGLAALTLRRRRL